jgi:hypothetical protein
MKRPLGIKLTTLLLCVLLLCTLPVMLAGRVANHWSQRHSLTALTLHTIIVAVLALILLAGVGSIVWLYFHGRIWARNCVIVLCLICMLPIGRLLSIPSHTHVGLLIVRAICAVLVLGYQLLPAANDWFASHPPDDITVE